MRRAMRHSPGPSLLIVSFLLAGPSFVSGQEPTPADWQQMIWRSTAVVTPVVDIPHIQVVRPEKDVERIVERPDGRRLIFLPAPSDYLVGEVTRFSVETVHKKKPGVPLGESVDVFYPAHATPMLQAGQRLLLFLQNPIAFDALMIKHYGDWSGLLGTTLKYPLRLDRTVEPFAVASAYSLVFPEPSVPNALELTPENDALTEAALAEVPIAAEPSRLTGPVASWRFEEARGRTTTDHSGNGNAGTLENGATWRGGRLGTGLRLDGVDDQVRVAASPSLNITGEGLTLEAWVKPNSVKSNRVLIHKEKHYSLALYRGQVTYADSITWSYASIGYYGRIPTNTWSHVAVTFDGTAIRFYINGVLVGSKARAGVLTDNGSPVCLGSYDCRAYRANGTLDDVAIYDRALSEAEIRFR